MASNSIPITRLKVLTSSQSEHWLRNHKDITWDYNSNRYWVKANTKTATWLALKGLL